MPSPILIALVLIIALVAVGYIFFFRAPSAQANQTARDHLNAFYAAADPEKSQLTVILYAHVLGDGRLSAVLLGLPYYEKLDLRRMTLPRRYDDYINLPNDAIGFRQIFEAGDAGVVERTSHAAMNKTLSDLKATGWTIEMQIPFSDVDHLVYLSRSEDA